MQHLRIFDAMSLLAELKTIERKLVCKVSLNFVASALDSSLDNILPQSQPSMCIMLVRELSAFGVACVK